MVAVRRPSAGADDRWKAGDCHQPHPHRRPANKDGQLVRIDIPWAIYLKGDKTTPITPPNDGDLGAAEIAVDQSSPDSTRDAPASLFQLTWSGLDTGFGEPNRSSRSSSARGAVGDGHAAKAPEVTGRPQRGTGDGKQKRGCPEVRSLACAPFPSPSAALSAAGVSAPAPDRLVLSEAEDAPGPTGPGPHPAGPPDVHLAAVEALLSSSCLSLLPS